MPCAKAWNYSGRSSSTTVRVDGICIVKLENFRTPPTLATFLLCFALLDVFLDEMPVAVFVPGFVTSFSIKH